MQKGRFTVTQRNLQSDKGIQKVEELKTLFPLQS